MKRNKRETHQECNRRKQHRPNKQCEEVETLCRTHQHSRHDKIRTNQGEELERRWYRKERRNSNDE